MELNITNQILQLFSVDIWKDFRRLEVSKRGHETVIRRYSDHETSIEFEIWFIQQLRDTVRFQIPRIVEQTKNAITFEYLRGTRAFNLLSDLKSLHLIEKDTSYHEAGIKLLDFLQEDLNDFQKNARFTADNKFAPVAYPVHKKLDNVYTLLGKILGIEFSHEDLSTIGNSYLKLATIPFRDATTKNVILNIPALYQTNFSSYEDRLKALKKMVHSGELNHLIQRDSIYHIDFSGCQYLCPDQDDWVAIREHEGSKWLNLSPESDFDKLSNEELCVFFVRFTRFGGRKLLYRLLNYPGYKVRFCHDHEAYYFNTLEKICRILIDRKFLTSSSWCHQMKQLEQATSIVSSKDHFLSWKTEEDLSRYYSDVFPD